MAGFVCIYMYIQCHTYSSTLQRHINYGWKHLLALPDYLANPSPPAAREGQQTLLCHTHTHLITAILHWGTACVQETHDNSHPTITYSHQHSPVAQGHSIRTHMCAISNVKYGHNSIFYLSATCTANRVRGILWLVIHILVNETK